ncbi:MAG TPA: hypothetical protein VN428_24570 [Bryobacteraceae bacterium]|nr:hypothetical protein [Bryobacteraceae bacterium]
MDVKMDNRTLAAIGGVGLGTGLAYLLSRRQGRRHGLIDRVRDVQWTERGGRPGQWAPASRFLAGMTGGALSYYGMRRHGMLGKLMAATGMGLVTRGTTNLRTRQAFGIMPVLARMGGRG